MGTRMMEEKGEPQLIIIQKGLAHEPAAKPPDDNREK